MKKERRKWCIFCRWRKSLKIIYSYIKFSYHFNCPYALSISRYTPTGTTMSSRFLLFSPVGCLAFAMLIAPPTYAQRPSTLTLEQSTKTIEAELVHKYGEECRGRLERGLRQVTEFWRPEDGDAGVFEDFVRAQFAGGPAERDTMFVRFEAMFEQLDGHMAEIGRTFRLQSDLDRGPIMPYDDLFAGYDPSAHITDDFFANKLAFVVLLNFPITTLDERLLDGPSWSRRQWAETKLAERFSKRIPASVNLAIAEARSQADRYISEYNIWMHHVLDKDGKRLFPEKMRLLSHWNLRDQIKSDYQNPSTGLSRQRTIQKVMERIIDQTIPAVVVNGPGVDWNPYSNAVSVSPVRDYDTAPKPTTADLSSPEPDTRYAVLLKTFQASRLADPYSPTAPTLIDRRFNEDRQIPEKRVRAILETLCTSPLLPRVAQLIGKRLGRPLEPFDIWYSGFRAPSKYSQEELDVIVARRYPTAEAYHADIPKMLEKLGFSNDRSTYLAEWIAVDPARGSGHAMPAAMRSAQVRLRTRVEASGMNYKGYNIAVHEMGHNVEEIFSLHMIDHTLLSGVPNTAFTEALAFVFQRHDLDLLGLTSPDPRSEALMTLNDFWGAFEIAGVAMVDIDVWHWMYDHPSATPAELKGATITIARRIWNTYYAPLFGVNDVTLLAVYSHMIEDFLYLPDYPMGHIIAHQIEAQMKKSGSIGPEFERMAATGSISPDLWMVKATGAPVGPDALLEAAANAYQVVSQ